MITPEGIREAAGLAPGDAQSPASRATVRDLAARDPAAAAGTVDRLTRDPDPDPDPGVREAGARHRNLPSTRPAELLDDEELVHCAAANPALAPSVMRRLVASLPLPDDAAG